jgi:hypothetical protein
MSTPTPRTNATTVSDQTRKRQIGDLITHIGIKDNHLYQALKSLQDQTNQLVDNTMDLSAAVNHVASQVSTTHPTTGVTTTGLTPAVPGGGGTSGGSSGPTSGVSELPSVPPGTGVSPGMIANFVILNQLNVHNPDGSITASADFSWANPPVAGEPLAVPLFYGGVQVWAVASTDPSFVIPTFLGASAMPTAFGVHVSIIVLHPTTLTVAGITFNTVGQQLELPTQSTFVFSPTLSWNIS